MTIAGQVYDASITIKNIGTATWNDETYLVGLPEGRSDFYDSSWKEPARIVKTGGVGPEQSTTINFKLRAPTTPGNYRIDFTFVQERVTWFPEGEDGNIFFPITVHPRPPMATDINGDRKPDLFAIARAGAAGKTEIHIMNGADNFQSFLVQTATIHSDTDGAQWVFGTADYNMDRKPDLYAIAKYGGMSDRTELSILNGADNFQSNLLQTATVHGITGAQNAWVFGLADYNRDGKPDLYAIAKTSATTEKMAVFIMNGADNYQSYLYSNFIIQSTTGSDNKWTFGLADYNADGKPDLYALAKMGSASGNMDLNIMNGADGYQSYLLRTTTIHPNSGSDSTLAFNFADYNDDGRPDIYAIAKTGGANGKVATSVMDGANNYQSYLLQTPTIQGYASPICLWDYGTGEACSDVTPAPTPAVSSLTPSSATAGTASFALTVNGTNFVSTSVVQWNGVARPTTYVNATTLKATLSASDLATAGTYSVRVTTPSPGGGTSNSISFVVAPKPTASVVENASLAIRYDGWSGASNAQSFGGGFRFTSTASQTIVYRTTVASTSVSLVTYRGPTQGMVRVYIDGVDKGIVDLYSATAQYQALVTYTGLSPALHTIQIRALGQKNVASSATQVRVDGIKVDTTVIDDVNAGMQFGSWVGRTTTAASGGSYRISGTANATVSFQFTGTQFTLATIRTPGSGQISIKVDGIERGPVDLYNPTTQWNYKHVVSGLTSGTHSVVVKVLGTKNASSSGTSVLFDGYSVP